MLTQLKFLSDLPLFDTEQPYELYGYPDKDADRITNCQYSVVDNILVEDVRDEGVCPSLDTTGFTFLKHRSQCSLRAEDFEFAGNDIDNTTVTSYIEETMELVKKELGAAKVICFDWRFRRSLDREKIVENPKDVLNVRYQALPPGLTMHCDFSHQGGQERLEMHLLDDELEAVTKGIWHVSFVNAWRAFDVVENAPLVVTDRRSVHADDLIEIDKVLPDKVEKAYYVKYKPYHRWYYMSDQTPEDLALFKTWDSTQSTTVADFPPHGAATQFSKEGKARPRESVEVRMAVLRETAV